MKKSFCIVFSCLIVAQINSMPIELKKVKQVGNSNSKSFATESYDNVLIFTISFYNTFLVSIYKLEKLSL